MQLQVHVYGIFPFTVYSNYHKHNSSHIHATYYFLTVVCQCPNYKQNYCLLDGELEWDPSLRGSLRKTKAPLHTYTGGCSSYVLSLDLILHKHFTVCVRCISRNDPGPSGMSKMYVPDHNPKGETPKALKIEAEVWLYWYTNVNLSPKNGWENHEPITRHILPPFSLKFVNQHISMTFWHNKFLEFLICRSTDVSLI